MKCRKWMLAAILVLAGPWLAFFCYLHSRSEQSHLQERVPLIKPGMTEEEVMAVVGSPPMGRAYSAARGVRELDWCEGAHVLSGHPRISSTHLLC